MVALCVMQAVQRQGGLFLESSGSQQWYLVSPRVVERFVAVVWSKKLVHEGLLAPFVPPSQEFESQ
jgi:hypothetical protein